MRYVCLLRGINVGGNNKVAMSDLKACFDSLGMQQVSTYINSGNVLFSSSDRSAVALIAKIESALKQHLGMNLRVTVVSYQVLAQAIAAAPAGWGTDTTRKHNLLFIRPPATTADVMAGIGTPRPDLETVAAGEGVIFWSASVEQFGRTASSKLAGKPVYQLVTVRNYNTSTELLRRLQAMSA